MEFYQLEDFVAVVEEGSFSHAAERLFRTQPAVSQAIRKLEEEIGISLLNRNAQGLVPTEAGKTLFIAARKMLDIRNETCRAIQDQKIGVRCKVTIGAIESAAHYVLPNLLLEFHERHPEVKINVERYNNNIISRLVRENQLDLGFVTSAPPFHNLHSSELFKDPLVLIVPPGHRLAGRNDVKIRDLGSERFLVHHIPTATVEELLILFEKSETPLRIAARLWGYEDVKDLVEKGMGIAIVPRSCVQKEISEKKVASVPVNALSINRTMRLVYPEEKHQSQGTRHFIRLARRWKYY